MSKHLGLVLGIVLMMGACASEQPESHAAAPQGVEQATPYSKPMLPVFEGAAERRIGKADWYDDYRNANLGVYGITEAPGVPVRPMAEWEAAESLILVYSSSTLPAGIKNNFVDIIDSARDVVDIHVIYDSNQAQSSLSNLLTQNGIPSSAVSWINMANDSIWARDFGPISIFNGSKVGNLDTRYYHQRYNDDAIPTLLVGEDWGLTTYRVPLDMEGGNFMATTDGFCATSQGMYWYNGTSQANVNSYLEDYMGCQDLLVVQPMDGEGTTHIDMHAKFMTDATVVIGEYTSSQDPTNKQITDASAAQFAAAGFNVERIPMPNNNDGVFRSYTNSLLVNGVHIVPAYSGYASKQAEAMAVYESILPGWDHVTSNSDAVIQWSGAIHCISKLVAAGQWTPLEAKPDVICDSYDCYPGGGGPTGCGDVTFEGCCEGNLLQYCNNNQIVQQMCNSNTCGWDSQGGYYNCGTSGGSDPTGQNPKACDGGCTPQCAGKECGTDGCGGVCGLCGPDETCTGGACVADCVPGCVGKDCGPDGCGGTCGACGAGEVCTNGGLCAIPPDPCGDVDYVGCCDDATLVWCENNALQTLTCDTCGWDAGLGFYNCGFTGQDPSGDHPKACDGSCIPACGGKDCGDDGCGGSCGACVLGEICSQAGLCAANDACGDVTYAGYCDGNTLVWCEDAKLYAADCGLYGSYLCLWIADEQGYYCVYQSPCVADCVGNECGDDGCGGTCGACAGDLNCVDGACVDGPCDADCDGKVCGSDGCDGACGVCAGGETCEDGVCVAGCLPDCTGSECGPDGCEGSCGTCTAGFSCADGLCELGCAPDCEDVECGGDGCGGSCGTCADGLACQEGACTDVCAPDCEGRQCGPDGCGGSCGDCPKDWTCDEDAGACVQDPADGCGNIPSTGICLAGNILNVCVANEVVGTDCALTGEICSFVEEEGRYDCIPLCAPDCSDKTCGDDGCGGSCGACPKGQACEAGGCEAMACIPACVDRECGDDGCDGSCGTCAAGEICAAGLCIDDGEGCPEGSVLVGGECVPEAGADVVGGDDTGVDPGGKVSSGCSVGTEPQAAASWLMLALMFGIVAVLRRRQEG
ncbi:MAG: agmatine deiminase family protein [Pseudomonadota bacterium]